MRTDDFIVRALVLCAASGCSSNRAGLPADAGGGASRSSDSGSGADSGGSSGRSSGPSGTSDSGSTAASCQSGGPGVANCGASSESCCTSLGVSGGTYSRTYMNAGDGGTDEADPAMVSGFRLDKYLVTVGRFRQYVTYLSGSTGAPPANGSGIHTHVHGGLGLADGASPGSYETGWDAASWNAYIATGTSAPSTWNAALACDPMYATWTNTAGTQENLPIVCTTWWEAYAFCIWDGGFLPSEAEWEYAAAGGSQELEYPWGSTDPGTMNEYAIFACNYPTGVTNGACTSVANIAPVGTAKLGAGPWGQLDLVGDAFEWNLDWSAASFTDPCTDCAILTGGPNRVIAGCSFSWPDTSYLAPSTPPYLSPPADRSGNTGFRCARTP